MARIVDTVRFRILKLLKLLRVLNFASLLRDSLHRMEGTRPRGRCDQPVPND